MGKKGQTPSPSRVKFKNVTARFEPTRLRFTQARGALKNARVFLYGNRGCAQRVFSLCPGVALAAYCWAEQFWSVTALGAPCWPSKAASAECAPARPRRASGRRASCHQRVCILRPAPPFTSPVRPRVPVPLRRGRAGPSGRRACHQRVYFPLPRRRQRPPLLAL